MFGSKIVLSSGIGCVLITMFITGRAAAGENTLEEVVVTASFRQQSLKDAPVSATVIDAATLHTAGVQHLEDVLGLVPDLNWAAGTSRPRYYQLRGIGERDQYQGAPNSSVGFLIDDIDFTGMGTPATLFDVEQLEVLRGPQGTNYGANALAGLIKVKTRDPMPHYEFQGEAGAGQYGTESAGAVVGGPLNIAGPDSAFRLVAQRYRSDGFRRNVSSGRDDTNGFDELTTRAKVRLDLGDQWRIDLLGLYVDQDNGYDAWSLDNSFTTRSDYPGRDAQRSKAIAARINYQGWSGVNVESITTYSAIDAVYSFDDDWASNAYWAATTGYSPYNYYSNIVRNRTTRSEDFRFSSTAEALHPGRWSWVAGLYVLNLHEGNSDLEFAQDVAYDSVGSATDLVSRYSATNKAVYGQLEYAITQATTLTGGLRFEHRKASYQDTEDASFAPAENMSGGNLSLVHRFNDAHSLHAAIARGYKAGGFNIGLEVPVANRRFAAEYLWNVEIGDRRSWLADRLSTDVTLFYMRRQNQQVATSTQDPNNPASFVFIVNNAARGDNYGVESAAAFSVTKRWSLQGTLALLRARYLDYTYIDQHTGVAHDLDGRQQAHAPEYQYSLSANWRHPGGLMARIDLTGTARFYFDASNDQRSSAYRLVNARVGYESSHWALSLWGRNLFDAVYAQRGFYFGNEPPDFADKLYVQRGDPRQVGVTFSWNLR